MQRTALMFVAVTWLVASSVAGQTGATAISPSLRVARNFEIQRAPQADTPEKPSFVAPLVVTAAGVSMGAGSMFFGALATMGTCSSPTPPPGEEPEPSTEEVCDHSIPTPLVVTSIVGGSVGLLGAIWLVERLVARSAYAHDQRSSLTIMPTAGGAQLVGRF